MISTTNHIRVIYILSTVALISAVAAVSLYIYDYNKAPTIPNEWTYEEDPVFEWLKIGVERRRLENKKLLNSMTAEQYENELIEFIVKENKIVKVFPVNTVDLLSKDNNTSKMESKSSLEFWIAVFSFIIASIGTLSGVLLAWRNDRRAAIELELKVLELKNKSEEKQA